MVKFGTRVHWTLGMVLKKEFRRYYPWGSLFRGNSIILSGMWVYMMKFGTGSIDTEDDSQLKSIAVTTPPGVPKHIETHRFGTRSLIAKFGVKSLKRLVFMHKKSTGTFKDLQGSPHDIENLQNLSKTCRIASTNYSGKHEASQIGT